MPPDPLDWHALHASVLHILRYPSLYINTVLPRKPCNKLNTQANPSPRHLSKSLYGFSYGMAVKQEEKGPVWTVPARKLRHNELYKENSGIKCSKAC